MPLQFGLVKPLVGRAVTDSNVRCSSCTGRERSFSLKPVRFSSPAHERTPTSPLVSGDRARMISQASFALSMRGMP